MSDRRAPSWRSTPRKPRRRACDSCFKKKVRQRALVGNNVTLILPLIPGDQQIQCDAEFPQCNWCKHHNLACTYNRIRKQADAWYDCESMIYIISSALKSRQTKDSPTNSQ
ncbi:hypothetical protein BDW42DRAFT_164393 [Aspergillus taichungensis]|uniref:Zn(2)-C6 fungal-type domain-containing protein n=1 Tax=Aspergillus taichungensis TaxID=482145 RepID=A0A2J5I1F5_9EURO|nr:hypothetical protein BDW42DRAFT_164393 [Aspergillus taichungensis]